MRDRLFIDIFVRGTEHGKYDFLEDNSEAEAHQRAKIGHDATDYLSIYVNWHTIKRMERSNNLFYALKGWNSQGNKTKLKIRLNAHGADGTDGLFMGNARITAWEIASWLSVNGLRHLNSDAWALVISLVVCCAAQETAPALVRSLNRHGVRGFKVTASDHSTYLVDGRPGWITEQPYYLLGFIPLGWLGWTADQYEGAWDIADGSKREFFG